jgi:dTDP-4-dehydrorhamnose 3,5-epimerase
MQKKATELEGLYVIEFDIHSDPRGSFARSFCEKEFRDLGLETHFPQNNLSLNPKKGTLRGMHFQVAPYEEIKVITCVSGRAFDVLIDLRPYSKTFRKWQGFEISAEHPQSLYVPKGFAHGFLTLEDHTTLHYQMSEFYQPGSAQGVRWNDPIFGIQWPQVQNLILSDKDRQYPDFKE